MSRQIVLASVLVLLGGLPSRAQVPFPRDLVPTRTALARLGLERQFLDVVPLRNEERLLGLSMANGMLFAQTSLGYLYAYDAETGRFLWTAQIGSRTVNANPVSANSYAVFATNQTRLFALDRLTGNPIWVKSLPAMPSSATAADDDRVMVGLADGKIHAFGLKVPDAKKQMVISTSPVEAWNWQTQKGIRTRPLPAGLLAVFGSNDGKVYVAQSEEATMLYRIATGGAIGTGMAPMGTRLLLVPSADSNLYALDIFTAKVLWTFPSGAPIALEPLVAGDDIYVVNTAGQLSSIDPTNGSPRWTTTTRGGRLVTIGAKRIYLESSDEDLFVISRANGQTIASPRDTYERAGLNLRPYEFRLRNRENDRLYFATRSGMVICLRELGELKPVLLRDPKALPFGYIPRSGISLTPPNPTPTEAPPAEGAEAPAPAEGAEAPAPAETDKPAPAEEMEKPEAEAPAPAEADKE